MTPSSTHRLITVITTISVALALAATPGSASAAAGDARWQGQVNTYLATHPGGTQLNDTQIAYGGGKFIVTVARTDVSTQGTADCPRGWFCFYDFAGFGYPRGQLSDCGWQDLAWWRWQDRTASVHYNMSTGYVVFYNHAGGSTHAGDYALFSVSTTFRADSSVSPYIDMADHVRRFC